MLPYQHKGHFGGELQLITCTSTYYHIQYIHKNTPQKRKGPSEKQTQKLVGWLTGV